MGRLVAPTSGPTVYPYTVVWPLGSATRRLSLCSLLAANSQISVLIGQKMQLTGCDYGNDMRNAICVA